MKIIFPMIPTPATIESKRPSTRNSKIVINFWNLSWVSSKLVFVILTPSIKLEKFTDVADLDDVINGTVTNEDGDIKRTEMQMVANHNNTPLSSSHELAPFISSPLNFTAPQ